MPNSYTPSLEEIKARATQLGGWTPEAFDLGMAAIIRQAKAQALRDYTHPQQSCDNCGHRSDCATHNEELPAPCNCKPTVLDVVFDGPPGPESGRFVELEDGQGRGVNAGTWLQRDGLYWLLRISARDVRMP